ncbi:NADP-dependent oxidoreductase domain-containing protein [Fusarium redolens]|uniref:NADP-dependent oxidoreductase domain-containing protein n=1 Tax=Fusarium redolens TaxID=48865 RepID=A0A9P9R5U6_FUSRE|nr:NADP-dependent oxidoreductase domain-containing protein [Fusarium redolens]KAH7267412.1 NADP-dependent oxidoreductase domain-containing protein [Fusarium redolens]
MTQPNYRATSATTTPLGAREYLTLQNTTATIPLLGFGTYKIRGQTCTTAVLTALSAGYSHIDSAALYRNEVCIYEAIEQSGMSREAIFLTTKVGSPRRNAGQGDVYQDAIETVDRIAGVDGYVDLLLMHVPGPSRDHRQRLWAAMERVKREGRARSIGVSNFRVRHLEELKDYATEWPPSANQIELHPWCQQRDVVTYCQDNGIVIEAYSPLATGTRLNDPEVQRVASKHNKTPAKILIRYSLQKGWIPLPKSSKPDRIQENIMVFDFALDQDDMKALDGLDEGPAGAIFRMNVD